MGLHTETLLQNKCTNKEITHPLSVPETQLSYKVARFVFGFSSSWPFSLPYPLSKLFGLFLSMKLRLVSN